MMFKLRRKISTENCVAKIKVTKFEEVQFSFSSFTLKRKWMSVKCLELHLLKVKKSQMQIIYLLLRRSSPSPTTFYKIIHQIFLFVFWRKYKQVTKGQLNSEWIYEVIVSSKIPTKNYRDSCPGSLLEGRAKIRVIFGWDFGRNDDLIDSFWI